LSGLIGHRAIMRFAVAKQFHRRARSRAARDHGFARRLDAGNVERRHAVVALRSRGRSDQSVDDGVCFRLRRCERSRALLRRGFRACGRKDCSRCVNRRLAADVLNGEGKRHAAGRNKRQQWDNQSVRRYGSHGPHLSAGSMARRYSIPSPARWVPVCVEKSRLLARQFTAIRRAGTARTAPRILVKSSRSP